MIKTLQTRISMVISIKTVDFFHEDKTMLIRTI